MKWIEMNLIREIVSYGDVVMAKIASANNLADLFATNLTLEHFWGPSKVVLLFEIYFGYNIIHWMNIVCGCI